MSICSYINTREWYILLQKLKIFEVNLLISYVKIEMKTKLLDIINIINIYRDFKKIALFEVPDEIKISIITEDLTKVNTVQTTS